MTMDVALKYSPENLMGDWGAVQDWNEAGTSAAPTGWAMSGTAGSVARESTIIKYGVYSMKIISGASASYKAEYSYKSFANYAGKTVKFGMYVYCGTASKARIYINDGITTTNSSFHTGDSTWQWLEVTAQIDASNTKLVFGCESTSVSITAYFANGIAVEGEVTITNLRDTKIYTRSEDVSPAVNVRFSQYSVPRREGSFIDNVQLKDKLIGGSCPAYGIDVFRSAWILRYDIKDRLRQETRFVFIR